MSAHDGHLVITCDSMSAEQATIRIDGALQDDIVSIDLSLKAGDPVRADITRFIPELDLDVLACIHESSVLERAFSQWALTEQPDSNPGAAAAHLVALIARTSGAS